MIKHLAGWTSRRQKFKKLDYLYSQLVLLIYRNYDTHLFNKLDPKLWTELYWFELTGIVDDRVYQVTDVLKDGP